MEKLKLLNVQIVLIAQIIKEISFFKKMRVEKDG